MHREYSPYSAWDQVRVIMITDAKSEMAKMLVSVKSGGAATGIGSE